MKQERTFVVTVIFALTLAGYPLVSVWPLIFDLPSRYFSVPLRAITLILSIWIVATIVLRYRRGYVGLFWLPLLMFWLIYAVRIIWDTQIYPVSLAFQPYEYLLFALGLCFVPMLAFMTQVRADSMRLVGIYALLICLVGELLAIATIWGQVAGSAELGLERSRLQSETLNPISFGHLSATVVLLAGYYLLIPQGTRLRKVSFGLIALTGLVGVALASSRGPAVAMAISFLAAGLCIARHSSLFWRVALSITAFAIIGAVFYYVQEALGFRIVSGLESLSDIEADPSGAIRKQAMVDAWSQFLDNPLLGSRIEELNTRFYPHNVIVEAFMATGILGGMLFLGLLIWSGIAAVQLVSRDSGRGWIGLLYVQYVTGAMFSGALFSSYTMWAMISAVIAAHSSQRLDTRVPKFTDLRHASKTPTLCSTGS